MKEEKKLLEGSKAIALVINNLKPAVVSAYPITPQTHIVEYLAKLQADGQVNYEYVRAESEFAAASIVLGASATGVRTYSATSSQGLLLMAEVVYNIAGLRLPVVMTCANRAVSAPINIWNDHSDIMAVRDAGWISLFAADNQEAVDLHVLAYKLAESLNLPVFVNVDGFILTHALEPVNVPNQKEVKEYLPAHKPKIQTFLDPKHPVTMGAFFSPEDYFHIRQKLHTDLLSASEVIKKEYNSLKKVLQRKDRNNGLVAYYGPKNPETILVALGSVIGTMRETLKDKQFKNVGLLQITTYRPFPQAEINKIISTAKNIAIIEKSIGLGQAGPLFADIKASLPVSCNLNLTNFIIGLGGRDITSKTIKEVIKLAKLKNNSSQFIDLI